MSRKPLLLFTLLALVMLAAPALAQDSDFTYGLVLLGAQDDHGWSQAHAEAARYADERSPGAHAIQFEGLNSASAPQTSLMSVVTDMVDRGAKLIITSSDAFEDDTREAAIAFPDTIFVNVSGDDALTGEAPPNEGNLMGQMEWMKEIAGCAAALQSETGKIGYLGPLINAETRRLAASAWLGARYCWQHYRGGDPAALSFTVTWIGYWLNIPGVTLDPTQVANDFYDSGADVVISGIDTTEALTVAAGRAARGEVVWAVAFDYQQACDLAPQVCLGTPYFNWGPAYLSLVNAVRSGTWVQTWDWATPDWNDINNLDTSNVGFVHGPSLTEANARRLQDFIDALAGYASNPMTPANEQGIKVFALWNGPLNLQDGSELAGPGQVVDPIDVWYLPQLLEGMTGASE